MLVIAGSLFLRLVLPYKLALLNLHDVQHQVCQQTSSLLAVHTLAEVLLIGLKGKECDHCNMETMSLIILNLGAHLSQEN